MTNLKKFAIVSLLVLGACSGKKEADEMTKFADEMCACKDVACADKVFEQAEKISKANEGKEVSADQADRYNASADRASKCYAKIHEAADAAEEKAAADKPAEK